MAWAGVTGFKSIGGMGLAALASTPRPVVEKLHEQMQLILNSTDVKKQLTEISLEVSVGTTAQFTSFVRSEWDDYAKFVKDTNITPR